MPQNIIERTVNLIAELMFISSNKLFERSFIKVLKGLKVIRNIKLKVKRYKIKQ